MDRGGGCPGQLLGGILLPIGAEVAPGTIDSRPQVAVDGDDNILIVWDDPDHGVTLRYYDSDLGDWHPAEQVSPNGEAPQVGLDGSGHAWIIWTYDGDLFARFYDLNTIDGETRNAAITVRDTAAATVSHLDLAVNMAGDAVMTWIENGNVMASVW